MKTLPQPAVSARTVRMLLLSCLASVPLLIGACASTPPPTEQVAVATAAVAHAVGAESAVYAPGELTTARDKLARANQAMLAKDYALAGTLAQQAQLDAQVAEATTQAAKARKAADALRDANQALSEELNRKAK